MTFVRISPVAGVLCAAVALASLSACNRNAETGTASNAATPKSNATPMNDATPPSKSASTTSAGTDVSAMPATSAGNGSGSASGAMSAGGSVDTVAAPLAATDAAFLKTAAGGGLFEVAAGQLAASNGSTAEVKAYGSMLAEHHGAANEKLKALAAKHQLAVPAEVPADKQKVIDSLGKMSGTDFDRQFIETVGLKDHKTDIALFTKASKSATAPDVKAFASETLPTLQAHLDAAQKLAPGKSASKAKPA